LLKSAAVAQKRSTSNPRAPNTAEDKDAGGSIAAAHRRHDWVLAAVVGVLETQAEAMRACDVHLAVEEILGTRVRRAPVKACLASYAGGQSPRFVRVARGR
jgi:hypothetical protein